MRKLLMWIVVTVGIAALVRKFKRRGQGSDSGGDATSEPGNEDPAEELRRKLASSRDEASAATEGPPEPAVTVDERRADVHGQGRAAIDEMQRSTEE
jgi:hypothetical protein